MDKNMTVKWLKEVAMPAVKANPKNKNKGLIPRFHTDLSDQYYGGTKESLSKACQDLVNENILVKAFIKFIPDPNDVFGEANEKGVKECVEGSHKGMKAGKDGRLSTPIFWFKGDPDIPDYMLKDKASSFRTGEEWFKKQTTEVPM